VKKAKVVISQAEWDARRWKMFGFVPVYFEPSYRCVERWERIKYDSGAFHTFDRCQDLFRDGSVRLLPTPGHTLGHLSALVEMDGYQLLVTGDCLYTLRHLATKQVQAECEQVTRRPTGRFNHAGRRAQESDAGAVPAPGA
jgi:glyoxylase-like metal-dependent hydrolase (beta-lactamase superfamily II)